MKKINWSNWSMEVVTSIALSTLGGVIISMQSPTMRNGAPFNNGTDDSNGFRAVSSDGNTCFVDASGRANYCVTSYNKMTNGYKYNHRSL